MGWVVIARLVDREEADLVAVKFGDDVVGDIKGVTFTSRTDVTFVWLADGKLLPSIGAPPGWCWFGIN